MLPWLLAMAVALEQAVPLHVMADHAERVVVAEVTSSEVRWAAGDRGELETLVWVAVSDTLVGAPTDTVELLVDGGQLGEHRTWVSNQPDLREDHRYLLFLTRDEVGNPRVIGQQAAIELRSAVAPEAPTLDLLRPRLEADDVD